MIFPKVGTFMVIFIPPSELFVNLPLLSLIYLKKNLNFKFIKKMYEKEKKWNVTTKKLWVLVLILNFAYNAIKFLNAEGNGHPVIWAIFNMIFSLAI